MNDIGKRIESRRKELGISVESLAKQVGKTRGTIYRYESGYISKIPTNILIPLARALLTTPEDLLNERTNQ